MKAAIYDRYGTVDVVRVEEVPKPEPSGDQVLVKVMAASVNRADLDGLTPKPGFARLFMGLRRPRNGRVGLDAAGIVEAVGPDATRFAGGDRVFSDLFSFGSGAFAEYVCAPERAFQPIADGLSFEHAAALPHSAVLALQGLRLRDGRTIRPGDSVLVDGASGNVGPFAVQLAKGLGAEVTGTASTAKMDLVQSLGADYVIDYTTTDYTKAGKRYDWIVDVDSHHSLLDVRRALKADGVYVTLGGTGRTILAAMLLGGVMRLASKRWMGLLLWWKPFHKPDVERLQELIAAGQLRPVIDRRFALDDIGEALRWVDDGHARGKVIVTPADEFAPAGRS